MTTQQTEALRLADELCEAIAEYPEPTALEAQAAAELRRLHAYCQELESQVILDCMTHVQNPAENEHVAGDVSGNGAGLNMSTPHTRITELESQLAQRFDAADMATASAQGFRDGVASVSRLTDPQIASACMSYRHDFGLLDDANKAQLVDDARSWEYAFAKEREWAAADGESNG